mmetsp:Transcript_11262/g.31517  ORF Transcript_11262/g.31517 Transcript_11262/m.31517 type:complete len:227 (-) Transcript_11262:1036-1716(-)
MDDRKDLVADLHRFPLRRALVVVDDHTQGAHVVHLAQRDALPSHLLEGGVQALHAPVHGDFQVGSHALGHELLEEHPGAALKHLEAPPRAGRHADLVHIKCGGVEREDRVDQVLDLELLLRQIRCAGVAGMMRPIRVSAGAGSRWGSLPVRPIVPVCPIVPVRLTFDTSKWSVQTAQPGGTVEGVARLVKPPKSPTRTRHVHPDTPELLLIPSQRSVRRRFQYRKT